MASVPVVDALLASIGFIVTLLLWRESGRNNPLKPQIHTWLVLPSLLVLVVVFRLLNLNDAEADVDTSTWLASLLSVEHYPDKLWTLLNYTDSRPLTVLPLLITSKLGFAPSYDSAQLVGVFMWLGIVVLFYRTVLLFESSATALLFSWLLCLFMGTTGHYGYISYNSEHVSVLLIMLCVYWCIRNEKRGAIGLGGAFELGLVLGSLLYAKLQNVPMGLVIAAFTLVTLLRRRQAAAALVLVLGGVMPTLLVNEYYASRGVLETFWNNYFWNYYYYSYTNEFSDTPLANRFNPLWVGKFFFVNKFHGLYFMPLFVASLLGGGYALLRRARLTSFQARNGLLAFFWLLSSIYSVLQSGTFFSHYLLYLLISITYFVAWLTSLPAAPLRRYLLGLAVLGGLAQGTFNLLDREPATARPGVTVSLPLVGVIEANSDPGDPIVVWGWADHLYVLSERAPGYRMPHSHHLFMPESSLYPFREKVFLRDMKRNEPELFLDAAIKNVSTSPGMMQPYENFPKIAAYIHRHYRLLTTVRGIRVYKRK